MKQLHHFHGSIDGRPTIGRWTSSWSRTGSPAPAVVGVPGPRPARSTASVRRALAIGPPRRR